MLAELAKRIDQISVHGMSLTSALPIAALGIALCCLLTPAALAADECRVTPRTAHVVNVRDTGAKGDGKTDDTNAIAAAIKAVAGTGGTVLVPKGAYMVEAVDKKRQLKLGSDMSLRLEDGAILKVIPNASIKYDLLTIEGVSDVSVVGGTLEGDRKEKQGKGGEAGMGIRIMRDATNITIAGVTAQKMWGDGFYVKGAKNVKFCGVTADNNRRQGLSIISVDGLLVVNSVFKNTRGTRPSAGIDLEPNKAAHTISDVRIERSKFLDNEGPGILIAGKKATIANVEIAHNLFRGNRPLLVENAPAVLASDICRNRQVTYQEQQPAALNPFAAPVEIIVSQSDCENSGLEVRRDTKKKKKPKP